MTLDTVTQIQAHLLAHQYEGLIKGPVPGTAMNIIPLGPPGPEGHQAQRLQSERGMMVQLSTGDMLRAAVASAASSAQGQGIMEKGELVPDELMVGLIIEDRIAVSRIAAKGFILDGFRAPRRRPGRSTGCWRQARLKKLDRVVEMEVDEKA